MKQTPKQIKSEERSMMWAMILIIAVLFGFRYISPQEKQINVVENQLIAEQEAAKALAEVEIVPATTDKPQKEIAIESSALQGVLSSKGGVLKGLTLKKYKETIAPDSPNVVLLSDKYYAKVQWSGSAELPDSEAEWHTSDNALTPDTPITLSWEGKEIKLVREISVDNNYMFTVVDTLHNKSEKAVTVSLNGALVRATENAPKNPTSVHTGFVSLVNNRLKESAYTDVEDETISYKTQGGWSGLTDKYWQAIFIPDQAQQVEYKEKQQNEMYVSSFKTTPQTVMSGATLTKTTHLFAGAKELDLINAYQETLNIPKFDLTIDFGWFYFLTKPFLYFLRWLYNLVGNMGIAILIFATLLRLALLPVATKSYISMAKMKKIQPQMQLLQARYKDDKVRFQQEMLALYKREKVNPAGGCLPMLIQIPVFFALYKVLSVSLQMRQAPFFGWIKDLSMPDSSSVFTLFGLIPWPIPSFLNLGVMPVLMGLTMYIQQKMTPQPATADKTQTNMFKYMPIIFTFMMGQFAVGLILYWTWSNILSIAQQKYITKKVG